MRARGGEKVNCFTTAADLCLRNFPGTTATHRVDFQPPSSARHSRIEFRGTQHPLILPTGLEETPRARRTRALAVGVKGNV